MIRPNPTWMLLLALPGAAHAGMPMVVLDDAATLGLRAISFFLLLWLLSAWVVKGLWGRLRRDFARLPRLGYRAALAAVTLWGLLFVLVLTMISGARELMTPGAWQRRGSTYQLAGPEQDPLRLARRLQLERLADELWRYADAHGGRFPSDPYVPEIPARAWLALEPAGQRLVYVPGSRLGQPRLPLAYEPQGPRRLVLFSDRTQAELAADEIERLLLTPDGAAAPVAPP